MATPPNDSENGKPASSETSDAPQTDDGKSESDKKKNSDPASSQTPSEAKEKSDDGKSKAKPSSATANGKDTDLAPDKDTKASTSAKVGDDAKSDQTVDSIRTEWQKTVASILDNFCEQIKKETNSTERESRFTETCGGLTNDLETAITARRAAMTLESKTSAETK